MTHCATDCGRPTRDVLLLCQPCITTLEADLGDVAWLDEQLEIVLSRQSVVGEQAGGRSAETPLPLNAAALWARSELRNRLVGWCRDLADRHGETELPEDTLSAMSGWLLARIDRIAIHEAAQEIHGEIHEAVTYAAQVVDLPANRTTFPVGPCPEMDCAGEVRVFIPARQDVEARMECGACGARWEPHQWSRAGRRILERRGEQRAAYVDSQVAAALMGVSDRTIRRWVDAGRVVNHGDDQRICVELAELERVVDAA